MVRLVVSADMRSTWDANKGIAMVVNSNCDGNRSGRKTGAGQVGGAGARRSGLHGVFALLAFAVLCSACSPSAESPRGFRLPDGDAERGLQAFTDLRCNGCHVVEGRDIEYIGTGSPRVTLGGPTTFVRTYGELVTSIINPSHKLVPGYSRDQVSSNGESLMARARLNEAMTVQQLVDLVAFLQAEYDVVMPAYNPYTRIYP